MIEKEIIVNAKKIDNFLKNYFKKEKKTNLMTPMKYGTLSGGKKIRSSVIINTGKLFNLNIKKLENICGAVECIHSYSLMHDDLPCMDNDKLRRGKPSTHIKFGESTAVLAGSSLLTLAFEMIADKKFKIKEKLKIRLIKELAACSGHSGVAGGQELDLSFENKRKKIKQVLEMQRKKTGKLFSFCCLAASIVANKDSKKQLEMSKIGEEIGLLFQLADDFIDIDGSVKLTGKPIKKDQKKGKSTLINLIGYKKAYNFAIKLKKNIFKKISTYGKRAKSLNNTVEFILGRDF